MILKGENKMSDYTNYPNGLKTGADGVILGIGTAEPTKTDYTKYVGSGLTSFGSMWMESDGIHWSYNGTEKSITTSYSGGGGGGGVGDMDGVYSNGRLITVDEGAIVWTDATAGAVDTMQFVLSGAKSADCIDIDINAAMTGCGIKIKTGLGIAAAGIAIDNEAAARTGADILVSDTSTDAHSIIDIDSSGSGASIGFDFQGSYNGSPAGQAIKITLDNSDALDTEIMEVNTGTGNRAIMFDLNFGHADAATSSHIFDIDVGGVLDSNVIDVAFATISTGNAIFINLDNAVAETALHVEGSGTRTQPMVEVATDSTGNADLIDIAITGIQGGNIIDVDMGAACTGNMLDVDMNLAVASKAIYLDAGGTTRTANLIDVKFDGDGNADVFGVTATNTGSGAIFDIDMGGTATGSVMDVDMNAAVGAMFLNLDAGAGTRTASAIVIKDDDAGILPFVDINITATGAIGGATDPHLFDIDVDGIMAANILDITYGTAASTGEALKVTMGTNVAGSALVISGAGIRTDDLIKIDDSSTGAAARSIFDINVTGTGTFPVLDISIANASVNATAILLTEGNGIHTVPLIDINTAGTGATHTIDIDYTGIYTGNCLDITYGTAAATGNAIDINMGTNVDGLAICIASSGTGVSGYGTGLDIAHDGNLVAGADLVRITDAGNASSTSNLLFIEGAGTGTAGSYALWIAAANNMEAIRVDTGTVTFDESLSVGTSLTVGTTLDVTGATTLSTVLYKDLTEVVVAANGIAAAETGSVFFLNAANEFASTLPAVAAGLHFTFIVTGAPSGASYTIVTPAGADLIHGHSVSSADAGGSADSTAGTKADTITFVDGQAKEGDMCQLWCDGTYWYALATMGDEDAITFTAT